MKPFIRPLLLAGVLLVLVVIAKREHEATLVQEDGQEKRQAVVVLAGEIEQVRYISSTEAFNLKRQGEIWSLTEPEAQEADQEELGMWIKHLKSLKYLKVLPSTPEVLKAGFQHPEIVLTLTDIAGQATTIELGDATPTAFRRYLRAGDRLGVVSKATEMMLKKSLFQVADKTIMPSLDCDVLQMTYSFIGQEPFRLIRDPEGQFEVEIKGTRRPANAELVSDYFQHLRSFKAASLRQGVGAWPDMDPSPGVIRWTLASGVTHQMEFRLTETNVVAREGEGRVFQLAIAGFDTLNKDPNRLLQGPLALGR